MQEILNYSTPQITLTNIGINKEEKDNILDTFFIWIHLFSAEDSFLNLYEVVIASTDRGSLITKNLLQNISYLNSKYKKEHQEL